MNTTGIGRRGEDEACKYLKSKGYTVLKRNYRAARGEIDIIAKKDRHISFVEVKTRKNINFGYAFEAVNRDKQRRIRSAASAFIMAYHDYEDISFDVCEVYTESLRINYIENAF